VVGRQLDTFVAGAVSVAMAILGMNLYLLFFTLQRLAVGFARRRNFGVRCNG